VDDGLRMLIRRSFALVASLMLIGGSTAGAASNEQEVVFPGNGGVPIAGSLMLPSSASKEHPVAALLLIQGSGPTDRNGNQPPSLMPDLLRQVAEALADDDIASLRYDKRGMYANRGSMPVREDELLSFFSWSAFVGDARAALAFLEQQPSVVPDRVGIFGHSEGGLVALDLIAKDQPRPKILVLAGTPGRPFGQVIHDQLAALLQRQRATAEQRRFFLTADQRIQSTILATGKVPLDVPSGLAFVYPTYLGEFYKDELALDPIALAARCKSPILVINGAADTQVSATRDAALFTSALGSRNDISEVFTPDGVSHNLKTVTSDDDPGVTGNVAPSVKDKLLHWVKAAL
jgi:pimeloyl-ACP methyl ester carboxylesterase